MSQPIEAIHSVTNQAKAKCQIAPQPQGHWLFGHLLQFRRDVLGVLQQAAQDARPVLRYRLGTKIVHLVNSPETIRYMLQENYQNYPKGALSTSKISAISGEGLLTSNGEFWLRQRRLMQPAFHRERLSGFGVTMTKAIDELLDEWRDGQTLCFDQAMMKLTLTIVGRMLFSADVRDDVASVECNLTVAMDYCYQRMERLVDWPLGWPTRSNLRFHRALAELNRIVYRLINQRRIGGIDQDDLLSMLLSVCDTSGSGMTDEQVRNETMTMLMAGHETTANALTWACYLIARHPKVQAILHSEVDEVLQGAMPVLADLPKLKYATMVLKEAMRLYPPIWIIERTSVNDDEIVGYHIPARTMVVVSPYALHRTAKYWEEPEQFVPERFADETAIARFSYLPFGGGPHLCIGNNFAMMESQFALAMIAQRFRLHLVSDAVVKAKPVRRN